MHKKKLIKKTFDTIDADGSGHIDFEEFKVMMRKMTKPPEEEPAVDSNADLTSEPKSE